MTMRPSETRVHASTVIVAGATIASVLLTLPGAHDLDRPAKSAVAALGIAFGALLAARSCKRESRESPASTDWIPLAAFALACVLLPLAGTRDIPVHILGSTLFCLGAALPVMLSRDPHCARAWGVVASVCGVFVGAMILAHPVWSSVPAAVGAIGTMTNPNNAGFVAMVGALACVGAGQHVWPGHRWRAVGWWGAAIICVAATVIAGCITSMAALTVGMAALLGAGQLRRVSGLGWSAAVLGLCAIPLTCALLAEPTHPLWAATGLSGRIALWHAAGHALPMHWLTGYGFEQWQVPVMRGLSALAKSGALYVMQAPQSVFCEPLQLVLEVGIPALVVFVWIVGAALHRGFSSKDPRTRAVAAAVVAMGIFGLSQPLLRNGAMLLLFWFAVAAIWRPSTETSRGRGVLLAVMWVLIALLGFVHGARLVGAVWHTAAARQSSADLPRAYAHARAACGLVPENAMAWLESGQSAQRAHTPEPALDAAERSLPLCGTFPGMTLKGEALEALGRDGAAVEWWETLHTEFPHLVQPLKHLAETALRRNDPVEAERWLEEAIALPARSEEQLRIKASCAEMLGRIRATMRP